jgi:cell division protein FtsL
MDNSMNKNQFDRIEKILLIIVFTAVLLFMVLYWR